MNRYRWATTGDVNAFFGLMLDNIADLLLTVSLLVGAFGFPATFALTYMVPGTALGVVVGDLLFTWLAFRLARRTGRNDITAMPLGLDTPSTFGMVFFVVGPAFLDAKGDATDPEAITEAAKTAWQIGMCAIIASGIFKLVCAQASDFVRRLVPRAGLLGSLTAIALVLISFMPLLDLLEYPVVGFASLAVLLTALIARVRVPFRMPGALAALLVGAVIYYAMYYTGTLGHVPEFEEFTPQRFVLPYPRFDWWPVVPAAMQYLPIVIPFALATVVGGIDCTESAAIAGDEFSTRSIMTSDALATLIAGLSGGIIQTTAYIGHPAYKAMGGRAAYTLATALFVGGAGVFGYFADIYAIIPRAAIFPILIFIGLEITAQSFAATPKRHYPAVALACVPAMAYLAMIFANRILGFIEVAHEIKFDDLPGDIQRILQTLRMLSAGFIVTSLIWASALAAIIDRRLQTASVYYLLAAACSLFGIIHSPFPGSPIVAPWTSVEFPEAAAGQTPIYLASAYALVAVILFVWSIWSPHEPLTDDAETH